MKIINGALLLALGLSSVACDGGNDGDGAGGAGGQGAAEGACSVKSNDDGTATITCADGSSAEVSGLPGEQGEGCEATDNGDGTWAISCGGGDPVIVKQTAAFNSKILLKEGNDLTVVSLHADGKAPSRARVNKTFIDGGSIGYYEVSSDNKHVLFIAVDDTTSIVQLYVSDISGDKPTAPSRVNGALVAGGNVTQAHFSPDGGKIGYIADEDEDGTNELFVAAIKDGKVSSNSKVSGTTTTAAAVSSFVFSADGKQIAFISNTAISTQSELYVATADDDADPNKVNGAVVAATSVDPDYGFTPDGKRLGYRARQGTSLYYELFVAPVSSGNPDTAQKVNGTLDGVSIAQGAWGFSPNSKKVAYRADQDVDLTVNTNLYVSDISDEDPTTGLKVDDGGEGSAVGAFAFTSTSKYLVFMGNLTDTADIEIYSSDVSKTTPGNQKTLNADLADDGNITGFSVVPETDNVVFLGDVAADTRVELFFAPASGADDAVRVSHSLASSTAVVSYQVAKNGSAVAYIAPQFAGAQASAYYVKLGEDGPKTPKLASPVSLTGQPYVFGATLSNKGNLVWINDLYAGAGITDTIAPPVIVGSAPSSVVTFLD